MDPTPAQYPRIFPKWCRHYLAVAFVGNIFQAAATTSNPPVKLPSEPLTGLKREAYAVATTDTAFKHMFSISTGSDKKLIVSLLNTFVPEFESNPVVEVSEASIALPAIRCRGEAHTFMDLHVVSSVGVHYIVEMQAKRKIIFDERALFYGCSTYCKQLAESEMGGESWYVKLKPVIAVQVLDYDTQRVIGISGPVADNLVERVRKHAMKPGQFIKHFMLRDAKSGQVIDHLQLVQIELPRAKQGLFPPTPEFTLMEWWLSVLRHSSDYDDDIIERIGADMPEVIRMALARLRLSTWNPQLQAEYRTNLVDRDAYATVLAVERAEGRLEGRLQGRLQGELEGRLQERSELTNRLLRSGRFSREEVISMLRLSDDEAARLSDA